MHLVRKELVGLAGLLPHGIHNADAALERLRIDGAQELDRLVLGQHPFAFLFHVRHLRLIVGLLLNLSLESGERLPRGGQAILDRLERLLGVRAGATTLDRRFTLETVRCVGCCSLGPVVRIDEETFGRVRQDKLAKMLTEF